MYTLASKFGANVYFILLYTLATTDTYSILRKYMMSGCIIYCALNIWFIGKRSKRLHKQCVQLVAFLNHIVIRILLTFLKNSVVICNTKMMTIFFFFLVGMTENTSQSTWLLIIRLSIKLFLRLMMKLQPQQPMLLHLGQKDHFLV